MAYNKYFSVREASSVLGIEEARIRFYELVYQDFLLAKAAETGYKLMPAQNVEVFRRISEYEAAGLGEEEIKTRLVQPPETEHIHVVAQSQTKVIGITSGKGGVGKTTFALNAAIELARQRQRVLVIDGDLGLANLHILAGIQPRYDLSSVVRDEVGLAEILADGPEGIRILPGTCGESDLASLDNVKKSRLMDSLQEIEQDADFVLIDTGAGMSDNVMRFVSSADELVLMTTPDITAIADAYGMAKVIVQENEKSRMSILVNKVSSFKESRDVFVRLNECSKRFLDYSFRELGYVLKDNAVGYATQKRVPVAISYPNSRASRAIRRIAGVLLRDQEPTDREGSLSDLFPLS